MVLRSLRTCVGSRSMVPFILRTHTSYRVEASGRADRLKLAHCLPLLDDTHGDDYILELKDLMF
jgi:hypothetical protein